MFDVPHRRFDSLSRYYEASFGQQDSAVGSRAAKAAAQGDKVGKRALFLSLSDGLMQQKRTAGYIIENVFENDVAALTSWKSASHVEGPPKKKKNGDGGGNDDPTPTS